MAYRPNPDYQSPNPKDVPQLLDQPETIGALGTGTRVRYRHVVGPGAVRRFKPISSGSSSSSYPSSEVIPVWIFQSSKNAIKSISGEVSTANRTDAASVSKQIKPYWK